MSSPHYVSREVESQSYCCVYTKPRKKLPKGLQAHDIHSSSYFCPHSCLVNILSASCKRWKGRRYGDTLTYGVFLKGYKQWQIFSNQCWHTNLRVQAGLQTHLKRSREKHMSWVKGWLRRHEVALCRKSKFVISWFIHEEPSPCTWCYGYTAHRLGHGRACVGEKVCELQAMSAIREADTCGLEGALKGYTYQVYQYNQYFPKAKF